MEPMDRGFLNTQWQKLSTQVEEQMTGTFPWFSERPRLNLGCGSLVKIMVGVVGFGAILTILIMAALNHATPEQELLHEPGVKNPDRVRLQNGETSAEETVEMSTVLPGATDQPLPK